MASSGSEEEHAATAIERCFEARGRVQNVMFRQTLIRAMQKRALAGGASNDRRDKSLVRVTMRGPPASVEALVQILRSGRAINDWGAKVATLKEVGEDNGWRMEQHQVTTDNVDARNWNPNVTMHI